MPAWHDDDRFWESFAPAMFTPESFHDPADDRRVLENVARSLRGTAYDEKAERLVMVARR